MLGPFNTRIRISRVAVMRHFLLILLMTLVPVCVDADIIILKSGRRVEVDMAWEEGDQVRGTLSGVNLTYPKSEVERIERSTAADSNRGNEGFTFSVWTSGMNIRDAQRVAKNNKINLERLESNIRPTDPDHSATGRPVTSAIIYQYNERILEESASVELVFTPASERLYMLSIRWSEVTDAMRSEFLNKVVSSLIHRYGNPVKRNTTLFLTQFRWDINKISTIRVSAQKENVDIKFLDTAIEPLAEEESGAVK